MWRFDGGQGDCLPGVLGTLVLLLFPPSVLMLSPVLSRSVLIQGTWPFDEERPQQAYLGLSGQMEDVTPSVSICGHGIPHLV